MNCAELTEPQPQPLPVASTQIVRLPLGLLGFEDVKEYVLLGRPDEAPFLWLQVLHDEKLAFLVVPPSSILAHYSPELHDEDVAFLGIKNPKDALLFNIVCLSANGSATVNLKGPIVLNRDTLTGKQVIPRNATQFSVRHLLPVAQ